MSQGSMYMVMPAKYAYKTDVQGSAPINARTPTPTTPGPAPGIVAAPNAVVAATAPNDVVAAAAPNAVVADAAPNDVVAAAAAGTVSVSRTMANFTVKGKNGVFVGDKEIKISGINWYGPNQNDAVHALWLGSLDDHIKILTTHGFNAVRLTLCAKTMLNLDTLKLKGQTYEPTLENMTIGQHIDDVVLRLEKAGILVMFTLHKMTGVGDNATDIGPLWYSDEYPQEKIITAWEIVTKRYVNAPNVFAMDIKNEPSKVTWGDDNIQTDWHMFCKKIGDLIHAINPNVLIGVAGKTESVWSDDVSAAKDKPVELKLPDKVFYTPHFYIGENRSEMQTTAYLDKCVGNLAKSGAPIMVGEWSWDETSTQDSEWAKWYIEYMLKAGLTNQFFWGLNESADKNHGILMTKSMTVKTDKVAAVKKLQNAATPIQFV